MPFFISKDEGFFCVAEDLVTHKLSEDSNEYKFRPWRSVSGNLNEYNFLDFPLLPGSHMEVHCSPILHDGIYSLAYNRNIYTKTANSEWSNIPTYVWQGYRDQSGLNYVIANKCYINSKEIALPIDIHIYRICPYGKHFIITGMIKRKLVSLFYDGRQFAEITANGRSVYKCSIADDILFHSIAEDEKDKETYKIHQTTNFNFDYNSEIFQP